ERARTSFSVAHGRKCFLLTSLRCELRDRNRWCQTSSEDRNGVFQIRLDSIALTRLMSVGSLSWSGVDLFFVLSGFLIGVILLDERDSPRYFQTFYARRAYRILPLYGILLTAQVLTRLPFLARWIAQSSPDPVPLWSYLSVTQNIWMAGSIFMTAT